jgi:hypothetical protein
MGCCSTPPVAAGVDGLFPDVLVTIGATIDLF